MALDERLEELKQLNLTFWAWMHKQLENDLLSDLTGGMRSYIEYVDKIKSSFAVPRTASSAAPAAPPQSSAEPSNASTFGSAFGSAQAAAPASRPAFTAPASGFGFGAGNGTASTAHSSSGFNATAFGSVAAPSRGPAGLSFGFGGGQVAAAAAAGPSAAAPRGSEDGDGDDDGDGDVAQEQATDEPQASPEDLRRGEEDEETEFEAKCKLFELVPSESSSTYKEKGLGLLRVNRHKASNSYRMLMRTAFGVSARVLLNSAIFPKLPAAELIGPKQTNVSFKLVTIDASGKPAPTSFLVRCKSSEVATQLRDAFNKARSSSA